MKAAGSYTLVDIEVTEALAAVSAPACSGVAFLLRRKGRPVDFWMERLPSGGELSAGEVAERIAARARVKLLKESLREELAFPANGESLPSLTVAVCTKDRPETLARCLASLRALQAGASFEILVVDNAPSDARTKDLIASLSGVRYACEPKPGLDFARNRALQGATGELLAFLDDDVTADRFWLEGLTEAWRENPDAAAFTGLVLPLELSSAAQVLFEAHGGFRRGFEKLRYHGQNLPGNPLYPCGAGLFGAGANMVFHRKTLLALGGFDEALDTGRPLPGGGDLDIFYRVVRAGYPLVYEPRLLVFHQHRRDLAGLRRQYWSWGLGFMAFVTKTYGADPGARPKLRRLVRWWFKEQLKGLYRSARGRHELPPGMVAAELWGGVMGILGEYGRSKGRIAKIWRQHA